jgi:regulation of enolase protein 1 (concanavalin A-like superfamily)
VYTIRASGADIWDTSDAFHYAYQPWSGNGTFVVRVTGLTNTDPWAKAGIMFRESTAAGARHVMLIVTPANGVALQHRATTGGMSLHTPGALTAAPQWLMLTRSGATFTASQSSDGVTWRQVGTVSLALPADGLVGLAVTSHNNGALTTATFDQVSMTAAVAAPTATPTRTATAVGAPTATPTRTPTPAPAGLPAPWSSTDIGATGLAGSARLDGGVYTIRASGADIWDTSDAFHYAYQPWSGNGTFVVRVTGLTNTDPWAKAGIMFRESTAAGARHVMLIVTPANGVALQHRATTGGMSLHTPGALTAAPQWLMLTRSGATFTASQSSDGVTWRQVGTVSLALPADGLVGLAVTSHNNGALTTATFDQVSMTAAVAAPTATPTRTATPVGAPTATPTPTPVAGTVNGLRGEYYNNRDLTALVLQRVDATVNFSWGSGAPDPRIGPDTFSVRWTGQVEAPSSGTYTFSTVSDDGVRLWVNDVQVINAWVDQASVRRSGTIALEAGRRYTIRMEFYENGGSAVARLEWTPPGGSRQIIPSSRLFTTP